ncbi:DUF6766 family protein [Desertibaculum subflavum]|uniref:DUF6766 family protein n=1 Tax=Desertibaculum subflavum TaxID=2268458 RepID=UPI000E675A12
MRSIWKRYGYLWATLTLFVLALTGHWLLAWFAYVDEQAAHGLPVETTGFLVEVGRDTLENWQSEFLQLIWQVAGLAYLLYVGSPQSKEGDDRLEAKVDAILRRIDPANAERVLAEIDDAYAGRHTDALDAHR